MSDRTDHDTGQPRPIQDAPWVPPLDIALTAARQALTRAQRIDFDDPAAVALDHGSLTVCLRMLTDAITTGHHAPVPDAAGIRRATLLDMARQAHEFTPRAAAPAVRQWLTTAARKDTRDTAQAPAGESTRRLRGGAA